MSERTRVEYLVTISQGELADKTMRSFHQRLRLDLVDQPGMPLRSQVVLDRQHVVPALRKKSCPAAPLQDLLRGRLRQAHGWASRPRCREVS